MYGPKRESAELWSADFGIPRSPERATAQYLRAGRSAFDIVSRAAFKAWVIDTQQTGSGLALDVIDGHVDAYIRDAVRVGPAMCGSGPAPPPEGRASARSPPHCPTHG